MLTKDEKNRIRLSVTEKLSELREDIQELEELTKPIAPDNAIGRVSRLDAIVNKSVFEGRLSASRMRLIKLEDAYHRIDKPDFGVCSRCGKGIPLERLLVIPESTRCVGCA